MYCVLLDVVIEIVDFEGFGNYVVLVLVLMMVKVMCVDMVQESMMVVEFSFEFGEFIVSMCLVGKVCFK